MSTPLFSIIAPIYKVEPYLEECINSILSQTFTDYEIILVDDGSPDGCPAICDKYANEDQRIKVIHKENEGVSVARNIGVTAACGKYIIFVDSDDYWCENSFLTNLSARIIKENEDIILFGCKTVYPDKTSFVSRGEYNLVIFNEHDKNKTLDYLYRSRKMPGAAWIMAVRRELAVNINFTQGVTAEDYDWIIKILLKCKTLGAINDIAYSYRKREGSITTQNRTSGIDGICLAINNWLAMDAQKQIPHITNYLKQVFLICLINYSRTDKKNRLYFKNKIKLSSRIFSIGGSKQLLFVYQIFGPYYMGKIVQSFYHVLKKIT